MRDLIKVVTVFLFVIGIFFIYDLKPISAGGCCCDWDPCLGVGGIFSCCDECWSSSQCVRYHQDCCPPPPCNNSCNGSCTLPSCPAGYTRTNPDNLCSDMTSGISCTYKNDCKNTCTERATCYKIETNVATSQPTSIGLRVQDRTYSSLSTDPANPTIVRMACNSDVDMTLPSKTVPPTASDIGYAFRVNNYGVNNEWISWNGCTKPGSEDFCKEATSRTQTFTPSALTVPQVLKESAKGKIGGLYYTVNKCDSGKIYSLPTEGYYQVETNTPPTPPSSLTVLVDGQQYRLSSDIANPTTIKYPSTVGNNVQTLVPTKALPSTASSLGYAFETNNYGLNNEWTRWRSCASPYPEDYCIEGASNTQNFTTSSMSILDVLKQGAKGLIAGKYSTLNRCGANKVYSTALNTYYEVDNIPEPPQDVCDWDSSLLASDPLCKDPDDGDTDIVCPMLADAQCTLEEFLPSVGNTDSTSTKGCNSQSYTGLEVNNPLKIRVGSSDIDSNNEIKGAVVWFSRSNNTPALPNRVDTYTSTSIDELGIMILQDNNSWSNTPLIYGINSDNTWAIIPDNTLKNSSGDNIARVSDVVVTQGSATVTFELNLELIANLTSTPSGMYNFKSIVLDKYMLLSDGRVDISHMQRFFNWGIDLVIPDMVSLDQEVLGPQELFLNWNVNGTGSKITNTVINAYRDNYLINDPIRLIKPTGYNNITLGDIPSESEIGLLTDTNSWIYSNLNSNPYINNDSTRIHIGANEGGIIAMYLTAYDQACNANLRPYDIDLIPWIATKGGVMYSQGSFGPSAKDPSQIANLVLRNILKDELDTGTELISSREDKISNLIHPDLGGVRAINTYDSNDRKNYWFNYLNSKLEVQKVNLTNFEIGISDTKVSHRCSAANCLMYSTENIEIPSGYTCDKNTLFMSEKDITLNPNITESPNNQSTTGCIFIAKGNILIKEGARQSTSTTVGYDYIEGFLIAENQIQVQEADINEIVRDALEIKGGLVAIGNESMNISAILLERNLRLFNYSHPTLVVSWDIKYARLSEIFFSTEAPMYKQEVGFKVF